jgi:N-acetylmuramoyl-L-alanine amidase
MKPDNYLLMSKNVWFFLVLLILSSMLWSCASTRTSPDQLFFQAESCSKELQNAPEQQKYRSYYIRCIDKFDAAYKIDPSGPWAAAALYQMGNLYQGLHRHSYKDADLAGAEKCFRQIVKNFPDSAYKGKALAALKTMSGSAGKPAAGKGETSPAVCPATVTDIRYWSNPEYTRVVINADRASEIESNLLKKDPSIDQAHQRLYVDIKNSRLGKIDTTIPINDGLLKTARAGQFTQDTVRVVIDINSFEDYNIFSLSNPFRIVIDVRGKPAARDSVFQETKGTAGPDAASIAKQLALGVQRIIIDAGHGGKDFGAPGYVKGVHEKMVVLSIAKKLAAKIRSEIGCEVIMTRSGDTYLTLEERTAIANMKKGDLFISIHANAAVNKTAFGVETYFLNLTTDDESISVAARENATSTKNISELQTILNDLMQNAKINESSRLATYVQKELCQNLEKKYNRIKNKGVKQAPFYVLIGAQMPAILVETAFISNKTECQRLMDAKYQNAVCDGIVKGIRKYIHEIQPTANFREPENNGDRG